jgi:hypothetical protein
MFIYLCFSYPNALCQVAETAADPELRDVANSAIGILENSLKDAGEVSPTFLAIMCNLLYRLLRVLVPFDPRVRYSNKGLLRVL